MKPAVYFFLFIQIAFAAQTNAQKTLKKQRVIVLMIDGFGEKYYRHASMPFFNQMEQQGIYKKVNSLMPAVTNVNNMSIATGSTPEYNGITGNMYFDEKKGAEVYVEDPSIMLKPSIMKRAGEMGIKTALVSVKKKTIDVMGNDATYALCPECAEANSNHWYTTPPVLSGVYTREVNYEIVDAAKALLLQDTSVRLVYIHTSDYPMHMWPPEEDSVKVFLQELDKHIAGLHQAAPDAAILITADHDLNHKSMVWDLAAYCTQQKTPVRYALSPEKDRYMKHHRGFGGSAYIYLNSKKDEAAVRKTLLQIKGVEEILTREVAQKKYHLMLSRIGDLMVTGDSATVFGDLGGAVSEALPATYRSHGSAYETGVPVFVFNAMYAPAKKYFQWNYQLAAWILE